MWCRGQSIRFIICSAFSSLCKRTEHNTMATVRPAVWYIIIKRSTASLENRYGKKNSQWLYKLPTFMLIKWHVCNLQVSYCHGNAIIQFHFRIQGLLKHAAWLLAGLQAKIKLKGWHVDFRTWCWHLLANHILRHSCMTADVDLSSIPYLLSRITCRN